jgi:NADPH-dependent 2,4-dienoyl-CoA reductase/sulfur reductase-like enzyme
VTLSRIVVVGASLAGINAAESLREAGYDGRLHLVGGEEHLPYDRPPLSKEILQGSKDETDVALRSTGEIDDLDLDLHLGTTATDLDLQDRRLGLHGGDRLDFDGLVIATGARPRHLPGTPTLDGVHVMRTIDDALAVRRAFDAGARVAVVGAGFIGSEVAASARARGLDVTVLEALPVPLSRVIGEDMGRACAALHVDNGVDLRCGAGVAGFEGGERVEQVRLADGSAVPADVVIVGIGVVPATTWLEPSGLELDDGIICDAYCAASAPGVYAAGDVARWHHPGLDERIRVEHWTNAAEQGAAAARNLLAGPASSTPFAPVPYFWSDQYGQRIQFSGRSHPDDDVRVVDGSVNEGEFVALYGRGERLAAVLAFGLRRRFMTYRRLLAAGASWEDALAVESQPV